MAVPIGIAHIVTFALAFGVTALAIPPVIRLAERRGWVQRPGGRRTHMRPTPNVGGLALYAGFVAAVLATFALEHLAPSLRRSSYETLRVGLLLGGATLLFLVMWLDDVRELHWLPKFCAEVAAGLIAVGPYLWDQRLHPPDDQAYGVVLTAFNLPYAGQVHLHNASPWLAIGATVFWLGWMSNTINFSDGLDGLAAGISCIAALMLALHALTIAPAAQHTIALLPLALAGACAAFLRYNFPPARIFMGGGAELLGYVLGVCAIIGGAKLATVLLVLGVPILDVAWLIVARAAAGRSPMRGGRDHLHHRLLDLGLSPRQIVVFYYTLSAGFGLLGISGASPAVKLAALILLLLIGSGTIGYAALTTRSQRREDTKNI
ncbi:MAG TPA: MraY family glycosyltransferase [Roseiflexaceae bacterium]|nr:MraY family glycosyltransferase [Roseiflexaceae bacterium]